MIHVGIAYTFHDQDWLGGRNYFASLFEAIDCHAKSDLHVTLITGRRTVTSLPRQFPWINVVRTAALDRHHPLWWLRQIDLRARDRDRMLDRILFRAGVDVLSHSGHLGRGSAVPAVAWLYDFQFMHLPELWQPRHIRWAVKRYRAACNTCDGVIVSSQSALGDLRTFAPGCPARAHVLPFVSNRISELELTPAALLRSRYQLPQRFFYLPNQFWENKNHRLVVDALHLLKRNGVEVHVVSSGKTNDGRQPRYFPELLEHIQRVGVADRFHILGIIPRKDALGLMRAAIAVLNPSRFEGWSTTVEEAKTLGVPLILSDIPVHREQVAGNGTFIHPDRTDSLAQALSRHLGAPDSISSRDASDYDDRLRTFAQSYVSILRQILADRKAASHTALPSAASPSMTELSVIERSRLLIKSVTWRHPSIAWVQPFRPSDTLEARWPQLRELLRRNYDVIVDGYPRSANSRLACALQLAAPHLRVRSHTHQIAHIRQAIVHHRKPAIVVIRSPSDAIPACAFHQKWTVAYAARYYALFHQQLIDLLKTENVLVVPFESIVSDLVTTVQSIAARHPSIFNPLRLPDDFEQRTDEQVRELAWGANPLSVSLPETQRAPWVRQLAQVYETASASDIRHTVEDFYNRIMSSDSVLRTPTKASFFDASIGGPSSQEPNRAPM